jgi:hypothetical protein
MVADASTVQPANTQRSRLAAVPEDQSAGTVESGDWRKSPGRRVGGAPAQGSSVDVFHGEPRSRFAQSGSGVVGGDPNGAVFASKPWAAPSVQALTRQVGAAHTRSHTVAGRNTGRLAGTADPLIVEGRLGEVLSAVGRQEDHRLASDALAEAQTLRYCAAGNRYPRASEATTTGARRGKAFGAVYEHRDCFGKPKYVGHTGAAPEESFAEDARRHQGIKNLLSYEEGRSAVVWSGVAPAAGDMERITARIVEARAREQHLQKLQSPKPYSRHGY